MIATDAPVEELNSRCDTEGCHRETVWALTVGVNADGDVIATSDSKIRTFCDQCKRASEWTDPWHPGDRKFERVTIDG